MKPKKSEILEKEVEHPRLFFGFIKLALACYSGAFQVQILDYTNLDTIAHTMSLILYLKSWTVAWKVTCKFFWALEV